MRTKPTFGKKDSFEDQVKNDDPAGCVWIPINIVIGYFVLLAFTKVTSGNGSRFDQIICYGALIVFVVAWIIEALKEQKLKQQWKAASIAARGVIVGREHEPAVTIQISEDGETRSFSARYRLMLKLPNGTVVRLPVGEDLYKRLENQKSVGIYYELQSPLTFLLEDEL